MYNNVLLEVIRPSAETLAMFNKDELKKKMKRVKEQREERKKRRNGEES